MKHFFILAFCPLFFALQSARAQSFDLKKDSSLPQVKLYGFITLDATYDFQNLAKSDVFKPGDIPVHPQVTEPAFFMSAKQTRLGLILTQQTPIGSIKGVLEMDFHNTADQPNGLARIRHAYLQWKGLTAGQTWSTFYDFDGRPQTVDYQGPAGSTFSRVPLIRYDFSGKNHTWFVALEDPTEELTTKENITVKKQNLPDLVTAYKAYWNNRKSFLKLGLLGRQLKYKNIDSTQNTVTTANLYGWGAMAIGKLALPAGKGKDNVKFEMVTGNGIARYLLGTTGMGLDAAINPKTHMPDDIKIFAGYIAYQHYWSDKFNSSAIAGAIGANDKALLGSTGFHSGVYATANLFYTPVKPLAFGLEYQYGNRQNINGETGNANRLQGTFVYNF
ncbi:MAG: porin [Rhizobacter sp.]|nr:porin [Ferruginibacter sp.]